MHEGVLPLARDVERWKHHDPGLDAQLDGRDESLAHLSGKGKYDTIKNIDANKEQIADKAGADEDTVEESFLLKRADGVGVEENATDEIGAEEDVNKEESLAKVSK
ncbi:unnamed protein product [Prunus armeniaca]